MEKTCYLMVGLPGSGKSTISYQLQKEYGDLSIVSTDEFVEDYAKKNNTTYEKVIKQLGDEPRLWMNREIAKLMKAKKSFIWDQTNVYASARKKKVRMLKSNNYSIIAIVNEVSSEELVKRLAKREASGGKKVGQKIITEMLENYTRPSYDEGFDKIFLVKKDDLELLTPSIQLKIKG